MSKVYDAVIVPNGYKRGEDTSERMDSVYAITDGLLGGRGYIRNHTNESFVTLDPADTLAFPINTPLEKRPRYDWEEVAEFPGVYGGTLKPEARNGPG